MLVLFLIGAASNVDPDIFLVGVAKVVIFLFLGCVNGMVKCPLTKHFDIFFFFVFVFVFGRFISYFSGCD